MTKRPGNLIVISGPSGAGKSTVIGKVLERNPTLYFSVSCTTRPPRPGEQDGVHYFFVGRDDFQSMIDSKLLLEHAEYVGDCYGTPTKPAEEQIAQGNDVLLDIEVKGAEQVRQNRPDAV
jgi:guanylate kinase